MLSAPVPSLWNECTGFRLHRAILRRSGTAGSRIPIREGENVRLSRPAIILLCLIFLSLPSCRQEPTPSETEAGESAYYPVTDPFETGYLRVSEIHEIYYELAGNPEGQPVLILHGGPGAAWPPYARRYINPDVFLIVHFDQRGAGQSRPIRELRENTTPHLVEDIERLRRHLSLDRKMLLFAGSWGTTLGLTYAEKYPENVAGMVLRGVFLPSREHIDYVYHSGVRRYFPQKYAELLASLPDPDARPLPDYIYGLLQQEDPNSCPDYLVALARFEGKMSFLEISDEAMDSWGKNIPNEVLLKGKMLVLHYVVNDFFLEEGQLLRDAAAIRDIPITMINGRYDMNTPPYAAFELKQALPHAKLIISERAGHWGEPIERDLLAAMKEFEERFSGQ
jgi:proline iminopeptidase